MLGCFAGSGAEVWMGMVKGPNSDVEGATRLSEALVPALEVEIIGPLGRDGELSGGSGDDIIVWVGVGKRGMW